MQFAKGLPTFANCKPRTVAKLHLNLFNHPVAQTIRIRAGGKALEGRRKGDGVAGERVLLCRGFHSTAPKASMIRSSVVNRV